MKILKPQIIGHGAWMGLLNIQLCHKLIELGEFSNRDDIPDYYDMWPMYLRTKFVPGLISAKVRLFPDDKQERIAYRNRHFTQPHG